MTTTPAQPQTTRTIRVASAERGAADLSADREITITWTEVAEVTYRKTFKLGDLADGLAGWGYGDFKDALDAHGTLDLDALQGTTGGQADNLLRDHQNYDNETDASTECRAVTKVELAEPSGA